MPEVNKPPLSIVSDATLQDGLGLTAPLTGPSTCSTSRSLGAVAAKGGAATSHATSHATSAIDSLAMVSGHAILLAAEHAATHAPAHAATHASAHAATRASAPAAERVAAKPREGFQWHSLDGSGYGDARGGKLGSQAMTAPGCSGGAARRLELTPQQLEVLLAHFKVDRLPSVETRERLAHELGLSARSVQVWFQNRRQRDPGHVRKPQHKPVIGRLSIDNALPLVTEREKQRVGRGVAGRAPTPSTAQAPPKHLPPVQQTPSMSPPRRSQLPPPQPQRSPPQRPPQRPPPPPPPPQRPPQHQQGQPKQHGGRAVLSPSSTARPVPLLVGPSVLQAAVAAVDALLSSTYAAAAATTAAAAADAAAATTTVGEAMAARADPNPKPIPNSRALILSLIRTLTLLSNPDPNPN